MSLKEFTNIFADGEVAGRTPDAVDDFYKITDAGVDHDYWQSRIVEIIQRLSGNPTNGFQILYGGVVTQHGADAAVDITAGAGLSVDSSGDPRIVYWPAITNRPTLDNAGVQQWVVMKYDFKYGAATRNHYIGTNYHYQPLDTYLGDTNGYNTVAETDIFTTSDPGTTDLCIGSFTLTAGVFADLSMAERSPAISESDLGTTNMNSVMVRDTNGNCQTRTPTSEPTHLANGDIWVV